MSACDPTQTFPTASSPNGGVSLNEHFDGDALATAMQMLRYATSNTPGRLAAPAYPEAMRRNGSGGRHGARPKAHLVGSERRHQKSLCVRAPLCAGNLSGNALRSAIIARRRASSRRSWRSRAEWRSMAQRQVNAIQFGCLSQAEFLQLLDVVERLIASCADAARSRSIWPAARRPRWCPIRGRVDRANLKRASLKREGLSAKARRSHLLLDELPLAVDEFHQDQRPLVDAEAVAGLEVVDAVGAHDFLRRL